MKLYEVKFEIYGKKLKVSVQAESKTDAKRIVRRDIVFHSVEAVSSVRDPQFLGDKDVFNHLMNIFHHSKP